MVNGISKGSLDSCNLDKFIKKIHIILEEVEEFKVSHVLRGVNTIEDRLSNVGVGGSLEENFEIWENFT